MCECLCLCLSGKALRTDEPSNRSQLPHTSETQSRGRSGPAAPPLSLPQYRGHYSSLALPQCTTVRPVNHQHQSRRHINAEPSTASRWQYRYPAHPECGPNTAILNAAFKHHLIIISFHSCPVLQGKRELRLQCRMRK